MEASKMKGHRKSIQGFFPSSSSDHSTNSCHNLTSTNKCLSKKTRCNRREYQYDKAGGLQTLFFMAGWGRELGGVSAVLGSLLIYPFYHCLIITKFIIAQSLPKAREVLLYIGYIGMCGAKGMVFQPFGLKQGTNFDHFGLKQGMVCARQS